LFLRMFVRVLFQLTFIDLKSMNMNIRSMRQKEI